MAWNEAMERVRARLHNRAFCYRAVFLHQVVDAPRPRWWQPAFWRLPAGGELGPASKVVLEDLRRYCHVDRRSLVSPTDHHMDPLALAFAEGRRDVFNRITAMCNLTHDQIDRIAFERTNSQ